MLDWEAERPRDQTFEKKDCELFFAIELVVSSGFRWETLAWYIVESDPGKHWASTSLPSAHICACAPIGTRVSLPFQVDRSDCQAPSPLPPTWAWKGHLEVVFAKPCWLLTWAHEAAKEKWKPEVPPSFPVCFLHCGWRHRHKLH